MQAPKSETEEARLAALYRYDILDAPREEEFEEVTRLIARVCRAPVVLISLIDRDRQWFVSEIGLGVRETPRDVSICAHAIRHTGLFIVPDTHADERFADNPLVTGEPSLRFYAGALLKTSDGHPLGTLCVLDYVARELTEEQKDVLQVLASQVMKQLELRRFLRQQANIIAEKEQAQALLDAAYAHEKKITEALQRSLLIDIGESAFPGLTVAPRYEAAWSEADVGGDFYDAFALGADKVALVVGDVAGKGLEAAARTAEVKYALRAFLHEHSDPARTLAQLNDFLCQFHDFGTEASPRFVVIALGIVDVHTGEAVFSHTGAEATLLLHRDGSVEEPTVRGLPLGIQRGAEYETCSWTLGLGDTLLLATDGLTEARQGNGFLGMDGLTRLAAEARECASLPEMGDAIMQGVKDFAGGSLRDDACLLLARRR